MTTNIEHAADLIQDAVEEPQMYPAGGMPTFAAQALADAGRLMPDLPTPEMDDDRLVWRVDEGGFVYINKYGQIATVGVAHPHDSPDIALRHALALIAAAHHLEREQGNGRD